MKTLALLLVFVLISFVEHSYQYNDTYPDSKIIFLLPVASKSHKNVFEPLIRALLERGHNITVVSPVKSPNRHPNLHEIHPVTLEEIDKSPALSGGNMFQNRKKGKLAALLNFDNTFINEVCHRFYKHEEIQRMLKTKETFDVAFVNAVPNQCVLGFVHHLGIQHINLGTLPLTNNHVAGVGGYFPRSHVPSAFGPYLDMTSFSDRLLNFMVESLSSWMYYQSQSAEIYREYLGKETPSVNEIDAEARMIFMNTHFLLTFPRPLLPNMIEVGGMHCQEKLLTGLPKDLQELLDNAKQGFIYFSLGSIVRTTNMPLDMRQKFINVFSRLKQQVIWKWDNENETDLPPNVIVRKWLPQQDILNHPNIKLFITHGGLLSTTEALYFGVPLLGSPLYVDQDLNMLQAENLGIGLKLEITNFTEADLEEKVAQLLSDSRFSETSKELSKMFRDQPQSPVERAVYWTEFVIRHKNRTSHFLSVARHLNTIQYHSIDVIAFIVIALMTATLIFKCILTKLLKTIYAYSFNCKKEKIL